jgi:hypothetical protein
VVEPEQKHSLTHHEESSVDRIAPVARGDPARRGADRKTREFAYPGYANVSTALPIERGALRHG